MAQPFTYTRRVAFSETDMAGIVHFAEFFRYLEDAEHAMLRSLGLSVVDAENKIGWPRVHAECDFSAPLRFEEEFEVRVTVEQVRDRSVAYGFEFVKADGTVAARGKTVAVCVQHGDDDTLRAVAIPEPYRRALESAAASSPST